MAKRGAEDQLTKDDFEGGRGGDDDDEVEEVRKDASQEALAGRKIRGLPSRKPRVGATTSTTSTEGSPFGFGSAGSTPTASSFTFGAPAPNTSTAGPSAFTFGSTNSTVPASSAFFAPAPAQEPAPATSKPSGFTFGALPPAPPPSTSTQGFLFGGPKTASTEPAAPAPAPAPAAAAAGKSPFAAFSFGQPAPTPAVPAAPVSTSTSTATPMGSAPIPTLPQEDGPKKVSPFSGFSFGAPKVPAPAQAASTSTSTSAFSFGAPPAAASASTSTSTAAPVAVRATPAIDQPKIDSEEKYLSSIRGLNTSVVRALEVALRQDAFIDLGEAMERMKNEYKGYLREIKKEAGKPVESEVASKTGMDVDSNETAREAPAVEEVVKPKPAAPVTTVEPPKAGAFTLPAPSASTASTSTTGGFKPAAPVTGFSFGGKTIEVGSSATKEAAPAPSAFMFKPVEQAKPQKTTATAALVQGMLDEPVTERSDKAPATPVSNPPAFNFGSTTPASPAPNALSKRPSAIFAIKPEVRKSVAGNASSMIIPPSAGGTDPVPFIFKASNTGFNMGSSGSTAAPASTPAGSAAATSGSPSFSFSPAKARQSSAGFSFGSKTDTQPATPAASETPKPAFSFGAPAAPAFSFGKPAESAAGAGAGSKPAPAFSFGGPAAGGNSSSAKPPAFSFGAPAAAAASGSSTPAPATSTEADAEESVDTAASASSLTTGQGEEDEDTLWETKAQIGTLTTSDEGKKAWTDWRVCKVKLKREIKKDGQADSQPMRRLLMRVDPSGHVYQNFSLRSIHAVMPLGPSGLSLSVAEASGKLKQIGMRFGKKSDTFDPQPVIQEFKAKVNAERRAMKLGEI